MSVILCTAGYDHTIRFWEALSGFCNRQIPYSESQINRLCISPNKAVVAAAGNHSVKLFSCKGNDPNPLLSFDGHTGNVTAVAFHCDAKWMVTSSEDGTVKIWDTKTGTVQRNYSHGSPVNDVVIHPNQGELISCDRSGGLRIWDLSENKCTHEVRPFENSSMASVSVASDGSLLCAGNNAGFVFLWKLAQINGETALIPVTKFLAHSAFITRVLISPDVKILATCSADHTARIWTIAVPETPPAQQDQPAKQLAQREEAAPARSKQARDIRNLDDDDDEDDEDDDDDDLDDDDEEGSSDFSPGTSPPLSPGTRLAPRSPRPNRTHQGPSQQQQQPQQQHQQHQQQLPQRPLRTAMTDTQRDTLTSTALQHTHAAHSTTAAPQGPPPNPQTGHPIFRPNELSAHHSSQRNQQGTPLPLQTTLQGHQRWVWDCAFSADSAYLVTACSDHYARLWELGSRTVIRQYNGHHRGAVCVALNDYSESRVGDVRSRDHEIN